MSNDNILTTIILIRHGETVANREGIFRGRYDFPLNENGIRQAKNLTNHIHKRFSIDAIFSSPLKRALDTARPIADKYGLELQLDSGYTNISLGNWEGVSHSEIAKKFPARYELWLTEPERLEIPDGEKLSEVQKRAVESTAKLVRQYEGKTIAIVSHRAVLKPLIAGLISIEEPYFWKIHIDNASYSIIHHTNKRGYMLYKLNVNHYLQDFVQEE
ncbi:histidine phosphatase family protein [bacterium]|nr:MAG: histidine phosphatase family protein [bacterium]